MKESAVRDYLPGEYSQNENIRRYGISSKGVLQRWIKKSNGHRELKDTGMENYVYAIGKEKEPRFDFLIPYGSYLQEQTRKYKKDIKNAKNWTYIEEDDCFICPNGRKVTFKKYQNKKNQSGYEQSFKIYECEDCKDCPLKPQCTKAKGNHQVHWNTIFKEMKAKSKAALECDGKAAIYARRKIEVESVFGRIKGNRSFRRFHLRGLDKVHV